jgi:hypothetical protein
MESAAAADQEAVDVVIVGGGVAGLTLAHELAERNLRVLVLEKNSGLGGKAISYETDTHGLPGEHGIHVFPAFYANFNDVLSRIPLDPVNPQAGRVPDQLIAIKAARPSGKRGPKTWRDRADRFLLGLGIVNLGLMCPRRSRARYTTVPFRDYFDFPSRTPRTQRDVFARPQLVLAARGDLCDALTICDFAFAALFCPPGQRLRTFTAPTHVALFDRWRDSLANTLGVRFRLGVEVDCVSVREGSVETVADTAGNIYRGRYFAFTVPFEALAKIVARNPRLLGPAPCLESLRHLRAADFGGLQLFLRGAAPAMRQRFHEPDHPWLLVCLDHSSYFEPGVCKGFTVVSTIIGEWDTPGLFVKKPARDCTAAELTEEILGVLRRDFPEADFSLEGSSLDRGLARDREHGWRSTNPLFVSHTGTFWHRPPPGLHGRNLVLAGDYTRTTHTLTASMEAACESGRTAARAILDRERKGHGMEVKPIVLPWWVRGLRRLDGFLYWLGLPNPLDLLYRLCRFLLRTNGRNLSPQDIERTVHRRRQIGPGRLASPEGEHVSS